MSLTSFSYIQVFRLDDCFLVIVFFLCVILQAALVVLWDLMVVNNWHVFLKEYANVVSA